MSKSKFVEGTPNPKRRSSKKSRGFGVGIIGSDNKSDVDKWCQSKDPLFGIKGKERAKKLKDII